MEFFLVLFCSVLSIPVSLSARTTPSFTLKTNQFLTSTTPSVFIPRLETWARAMQLSFRSISEPPAHSQSEFQSQLSGMIPIPYRGTSESLLPTPLDPSNTPSMRFNLLDTNITVNNICKKTEFPDQCISTVSPFLKKNSNVSAILERTMKSTLWLIKLGSINAQRLSNTTEIPKDERKVFKKCKDNYDNAWSNFQEAIKALGSKHIKRVNSMLKAVLSDMEDCRDEYFGKRKSFSLSTYDDKVTKMTSNCITIVDMVQEHP